jgi:hypothetical protein
VNWARRARAPAGLVLAIILLAGCRGVPATPSGSGLPLPLSLPSGTPPSSGAPIGSPAATIHVSDPGSGLGYDIPAGWETDTDDLVEFFTAISAPDVSGEAPSMQLVASGPYDAALGEPVTDENVAAITRRDADGFSDFFFPPGERTTLLDEPVDVSGVHGHRVRLRIAFSKADQPPMIVESRTVVGERPAFLLVMSVDDGGPMVAELDAVLESLTVEP